MTAAQARAFETVQDTRLHELRSARREAVREAVLAAVANKSDEPASFGLLVVPVDFSDARHPVDWQAGPVLGSRLSADRAGSLTHYFHVASRGRTAVEVLLAPLVRLGGRRIDYAGHPEKVRALAREALTGARDAGVLFAAADADEDGEVDGVLILHAGPGQGNDFENGIIAPQQFFLTDPVTAAGVRAAVFAVASAAGPLGMWAHETGHLLGLEDRYDFALPARSEAVSRGGLGNFSLMAAGLWGSGEGHDPALPDAYSRIQLGWLELSPLHGDGTRIDTLQSPDATGRVPAIWPGGEPVRGPGAEFFLLEIRGDPRVAPYDAALPAGQLTITHVDENLAEGEESSNQWPDRHLRVRLVEADGDSLVARGLEHGGAADVYPGSTGNRSLSRESLPPAQDYEGRIRFALTDITTVTDGIALRVDDRIWPQVAVELTLPPAPPYDVTVRVRELGRPLESLEGVLGTAPQTAPLGRFDTEPRTVFEEVAAGVWEPVQPLRWILDEPLPADAATTFTVGLLWDFEPGEPTGADFTRRWVWSTASNPLDFATRWPDGWAITATDGGDRTTWHRWNDTAALRPDARPVLACTGTPFTTAATWPEVSYGNETDLVLASPWLAETVTAVRLLHHVDVEMLHGTVGVDAAVMEWERADGTVVAATPLGGYPATAAGDAGHALGGREVWAAADSLLAGSEPQWRVDIVPVPDDPGPWRPRLRLVSSRYFRARGWVVAEWAILTGPVAEHPVPATWLETVNGRPWLVWRYDAAATWQRVEASVDGGRTWQAAWSGRHLGMLPENSVLLRDLELPEPAARGTWLRVVLTTEAGEVALRPLLWQRPTRALEGALGAPYPNPTRAAIRVLADPAGDPTARLAVHDLRGRRVRTWDLGGTRTVISWDGTDAHQRRVASGPYIFRLVENGRTHTRKATLLR